MPRGSIFGMLKRKVSSTGAFLSSSIHGSEAGDAAAQSDNAHQPFPGEEPEAGGIQKQTSNASVKSGAGLMRVPSQAKIAPALEQRSQIKSGGRPLAPSIVDGSVDRFWSLSDVLEDKDVSLSWRLRVMMAHDLAKELKTLHEANAVHGRLLIDAAACTQECRVRIKDTGVMVRASEDLDKKRDVLFLGVILVQLALHQCLDLGGTHARRGVAASIGGAKDESESAVVQGIEPSRFESLKTLFALELGGGDTMDLQGDLDFQSVLATEVRGLAGFLPQESENIRPSAVSSFEELVAQCCGVLAENRPEAEAIEDWLASIVDEIGGQKLTDADVTHRQEVAGVLQPKDTELLGDVALAVENRLVTAGPEPPPTPSDSPVSEKPSEDGYETDDSFLPTEEQQEALQRRPSRLSMFIGENEVKAAPDTVGKLRSEDKPSKLHETPSKKNRRLSMKPSASAFAKFTGHARERARSVTKTTVSVDHCRKVFDQQGRLTQEEILALLNQAELILRQDPNLPVMEAPVTVVGDIHGQYYDLVNMMTLAGKPGPQSKYLFLGDYVDRGDWSCEVLFYLLAVKVSEPDHVTLIRGNHECDTVSSYFGFKEECERKYGRAIFYKCLNVFQAMPVGAILDTGGAGRFLCVHGGISPHVTSLDQFEKLDRFAEPGMNGFLCDVLWADPIKDDFDDGQHDKLGDFLSMEYISNPARGCSYRYGYSAIVSFLAQNRLTAIIRAHEVMQQGYKYHFQQVAGGGKARIMPPVITVFSAPNYLGKYGNKGAFLRVASAVGLTHGFKPVDLLEPVQFEAVDHPVPLELESETEKQQFKIEQTCPYMPTTFETFVRAALAFGQEPGVLEGEEEPQSVFELAAAERVPAMMIQRKASMDRVADELRKDRSVLERPEMTGVIDLGKLLVVEKPKRNSLKALEGKTAGVGALISKFNQFKQAAAMDGINELHPALVQEKMAKAKAKVEGDVSIFKVDYSTTTRPGEVKASKPASSPSTSPVPSLPGRGLPAPSGGKPPLPGVSRPGLESPATPARALSPPATPTSAARTGPRVPRPDERSLAAKGVFSSSPSARKTVVQATTRGTVHAKQRPDSWIKKKDKAEGDQPPKENKGGLLASSTPLALEVAFPAPAPAPIEIEFSEDEIICLNMLYFLIDRDGSGGIDVKAIISWSAMDGSTISKDDAQLVIDSLDLDQDGKVMFQDYLSFAAALKQMYESKNKTEAKAS